MDDSGKQIWKADYQPFGQAKITGYLKFNLRADGQYQDDETGLYYNWYRYYNPDLGRYITSDPLGLQAGMNTYIYVNGNPINYTDPMGLCTWCGTAAVVGIGIAANMGVEAYSEYRSGKYSPINLAISGGIGGIGGELSAASDLMEMGLLQYATYNLAANSFTGGLQQATQNMCDGKRITDGVADSSISAMKHEALGLGFHAGSLYVGGTVMGSYAVGATAVQRYNSGQKLLVKYPYKQAFTQSRQNADQIGLILETIVPTQAQMNQANQQ